MPGDDILTNSETSQVVLICIGKTYIYKEPEEKINIKNCTFWPWSN